MMIYVVLLKIFKVITTDSLAYLFIARNSLKSILKPDEKVIIGIHLLMVQFLAIFVI